MLGFSEGRERVGVSGVGNQLAYFQNNHRFLLGLHQTGFAFLLLHNCFLERLIVQ